MFGNGRRLRLLRRIHIKIRTQMSSSGWISQDLVLTNEFMVFGTVDKLFACASLLRTLAHGSGKADRLRKIRVSPINRVHLMQWLGVKLRKLQTLFAGVSFVRQRTITHLNMRTAHHFSP